VARFARVIVPDFGYHVTHRGNHREDIFFSPHDRQTYMLWLAHYAKRHAMDIWAYCLMTNHVHLIVTGRRKDSLAGAIGRAHMRYARFINRRNGWTGHLWANRYFSTPLDEAHLWRAVKYVELNPVRAGMAGRAEEYEWSSAAAHCGLRGEDALLAAERPFPGLVEDWSAWLAGGLPDEHADAIRRNTYTGRPCGDESFVERVEKLLGRALRPNKRGRKPKEQGIK
jgi:putative transposase